MSSWSALRVAPSASEPAPTGYAHDDLVGVAQGHGEDGEELLLLLDEPHHLLGGVAEVLRAWERCRQPRERRLGSIRSLLARSTHSSRRSFISSSRSSRWPHLGGQALVAQDERRAGEAYCDLLEMFFISTRT